MLSHFGPADGRQQDRVGLRAGGERLLGQGGPVSVDARTPEVALFELELPHRSQDLERGGHDLRADPVPGERHYAEGHGHRLTRGLQDAVPKQRGASRVRVAGADLLKNLRVGVPAQTPTRVSPSPGSVRQSRAFGHRPDRCRQIHDRCPKGLPGGRKAVRVAPRLCLVESFVEHVSDFGRMWLEGARLDT